MIEFEIPPSVKKELLELLKRGVITGFSNQLHPRIKGGKEVKEELCIRVFVEKKLPEIQLRKEEVVPKKIQGIPTDVVQKGKIRTLQLDPTQNFRPLTAGISVGNIKITAGTLSIPFYSSSGELVDSSNGHVLTPDATLPPDQIDEKRICQAGAYDLQQRNQNPLDWISHEYLFHYQVHVVGESNCPVGKLFSSVYNTCAKVFGARTRLKAITQETLNHVDVAFAIRKVDNNNLIWNTIKLDGKKFTGWLFAGSNEATVISKVKYVLDKWKPYLVDVYEPAVNDVIEKWGRTTGHTSGKVTEASATLQVYYGNNKFAIFDDVIVTEPMSQGGDSGSPTFLVQ